MKMSERKFFSKLENIPQEKQAYAYQTIVGSTKSYDENGNEIAIHPQYAWTWDASPKEAPELWDEALLDD